MSDVIEKKMATEFIGRGAQVAQLLQLIGQNKAAVYPAIFVCGRSATGKTSVVRTIFAQQAAKDPQVLSFAYINCIEVSSSRVLFERCLNQLAGVVPTAANSYESYRRCDKLADFIRHLKELTSLDTKKARFLILDNSERLRDLGLTLISSLTKLSELTRANVCVVFISTIVWDKFRPSMGCLEPIHVSFPDYNKEETISILMLDCPDPSQLDLFAPFADLLYSIFQGPCRDLNELRHLAALLFPKYIEPVTLGTVAKNDANRLFHHIEPYFRQLLDKLYLREVSRSEWQRVSQPAIAQGAQVMSSSTQLPQSDLAQLDSVASQRAFELPYYTKFLLLAAFLASYNPSRLDQRYFTRGSEVGRGSRGNRGRRRTGGTAGMQVRQQLIGPSTFPLERLLAIFHHIVPDPVEHSVDIQTQLATLVTLRLVAQVSHAEHIESLTYRCLLRYDDAQYIARGISFTLHHFLYDFV